MDREEQKKVMEDLEQLNHMIEQLPSGMAVLKGGRGCKIEAMNTAFFQSVGYSVEDVLTGSRDIYQFCYGEDRDVLEQMLEGSLRKKETVEEELRFCDANGKIHWLMLSIRLYGYKDAVPYYLAASWDVDGRKRMEDEIMLQTERYKMIEELTKEQPIDYDVERDCLKISETMRKRYHFPSCELSREVLAQAIHKEDREKYDKVLRGMLEKEIEGAFEYRALVEQEDGIVHSVWHKAYYKSIAGNSGKIIRIIGRIRNIDKEKRMQDQLLEKSRRDAMTGLLNKQALRDDIEEFFAEEPEGIHAFMVIDIDNFKKINDTFGHIFGDTIIKEVAEKISNKFRGMDMMGRVGGDEFVVCMKYTTIEHALEKAHSLCESVRKKYSGECAQRIITCSVGISIYGEDGMDYETLFRKADLAMYRAKVSGKNGYQLADKDMNVGDELEGNREKSDGEYQIVSGQDKEFITFAFELLSKAKDIDSSINMLLERIGKRYGLDKVAIYERKKPENALVMTNCWVSNARYLKIDLSEQRMKIWEKNKREGKFLVSDCSADDIPKEDKRIFRELGAKAYAEYSYGEKGNPQGYITFCDCQDTREWTEFEKRTFSEIVRMLAVFVMLRTQREEDRHEIKSLQDHDPLTGLYNLNTFKRKAEKILRTAEEEELFAFICVDINGFSYINENFGYREGDQVLEKIAEFIEDIPQVILACRRYADLF
ncbi:MAG: diguanylate cyclase, partial [Lachnospiraceae bacterium]